MISEKIKELRKSAGFSQEELANKLGVSRQAITKWETGNGFPDIDNLVGIAKLFHITLDELVGNDRELSKKDYLFESNVEYDIDVLKKYDIQFYACRKLFLSTYDAEKLKIRICSNTMDNIEEFFKVKMQDVGKRIDVRIQRNKLCSETQAKKEIYIFIYFPKSYSKHIELKGNTVILEANGLDIEHTEYSGKLESIYLKDINTHFELDVNDSVSLICEHCLGKLDINQLHATSSLQLVDSEIFQLQNKGRKTRIIAEEKYLDLVKENPQFIVELNGLKSELTVDVK